MIYGIHCHANDCSLSIHLMIILWCQFSNFRSDWIVSIHWPINDNGSIPSLPVSVLHSFLGSIAQFSRACASVTAPMAVSTASCFAFGRWILAWRSSRGRPCAWMWPCVVCINRLQCMYHGSVVFFTSYRTLWASWRSWCKTLPRFSRIIAIWGGCWNWWITCWRIFLLYLQKIVYLCCHLP